MKRSFTVIVLLLLSSSIFAKKVKFAVNMTPVYALGDSVHAAGIHIYGNFQGAAGYPFDWDPGSTIMIRDNADTLLYSIVVDIPAFHVYEYRFINGDQTYEVEFVPMESRVNGNFDDNRWLYIDSLANDTTFIGILPFSANAPEGLTLVRFKVNMNNETVHPDGVHIAGSFQGWNPASARMGEVIDLTGIYEYQAYLQTGTYNYKFVNGNTSSGYEYVSGACAVGGQRSVGLVEDVMLEPVNFSSCLVGVAENDFQKNISMYPNPAESDVKIEFNDAGHNHTVSVLDLAGRKILSFDNIGNDYLLIDRNDLQNGIYFINIINSEGSNACLKLIVQ